LLPWLAGGGEAQERDVSERIPPSDNRRD
jgi:hypothetical protein